MATLTIDAADAGGRAKINRVVVTLTDLNHDPVANAYVTATDLLVTDRMVTFTDAAGDLTLDLEPNANITPANTYWSVKVHDHTYLVHKTSSDETIPDSLAVSPADLGLAAGLGNLAGVDTAGVADGQALLYDAGSSGWSPAGVATVDSSGSTVQRGFLPASADPLRARGGDPSATYSDRVVRIDFSDFADGDLADGVVAGLFDASALAGIGPAREDPMCVVGGLLGTTGMVGPDFVDGSFDGTTSGGRYLSYMDCGVGENFVAWTIGDVLASGMAAPATNIVLDHAYQGIGMYWNAGLSWWELGVIGLNPYGFLYLDTVFAAPPSFDADSCMAIRVCRGYVSGWFGSSTAGEPGTLTRVVGPAPIPSVLRYSSLHGVQGDQNNTTATGFTSYFGVDVYNGLAAPLEETPVVESTTAASKATGTSIAVTKPSGVAVGDLLVAVVASNAKAVTPPSGWTLGTSKTSGAVYLYQWYRVATSADVSASSYSFSLVSGDVAASMLRISGQNTLVPLIAASQANASAATAASASVTIAGVHRLGLWACAVPADTTIATPSGFTELTITSSGGAAFTLKVASVDWVTVTGPYGSYGQQAGTVTTPASVALGTTAASATCTVQVHPQPSAVTDA